MDLTTIDYRKVLLDAADEHCRQHSIRLSTLGNKVAGDYRFFRHLKQGKGCTVDTFQKVMKWLQEHKRPVSSRDNKVNSNSGKVSA